MVPAFGTDVPHWPASSERRLDLEESEMLRRWRSLAGLSLTAGLVLIISAVGALPAAANQGDIWTQPGGTAEETSGHSQEVHLPCGNVDIWGDKLDNTSGTWVLYHQPPPNTD